MEPGTRRKTVYTQQIPNAPYRNFHCEKYDECLSRAAYANILFNCSKCPGAANGEQSKSLRDLPRVHRRQVTEAGFVGSVEAAKILGITISALHHLRYCGTGPEYVQGKTGAMIAYDVEVLRKYLRDRASARPESDVITEVSTPAAAKMLGMATGTLQKLRIAGKGPAFNWSENRCMYKIDDLKEYKKHMDFYGGKQNAK